jgi:hypothetical protein
MMSKATFVYVPFIFLVYAFLDLVIFHYRPKTSWMLLWINGIIFAAYAIFTLTFQIQGNYTAKYKEGLAAGVLIGKVFQLSVVMKSLMVMGLVGVLGVAAYSILKRKRERSLGIMIYVALMAYIVLLMPWGFQSYLVSAIGPLALGALFPVYAWLIKKGGAIKLFLNGVLMIVLCFVFFGNIVPNISRMGDIGRAIVFLSSQNQDSKDIYFMPPPYVESADATRKFTQKNVYYCADGKITSDLLSLQGRNYLIMVDLFPSIILSGVNVGDRVFANETWQIFELVSAHGNEETFRVPFKKTMIQKLKVMIREL